MDKEWARSSFCNTGTYVEVAMDKYWVYVKTSTDPVGMARLSFTPEEWEDFIAGVKNGEFDL